MDRGRIAPGYVSVPRLVEEGRRLDQHLHRELYFDPETAAPGAQTSLDAKYLVVDRRWALVSSANFTDRGLTLEGGVLIEDTTFARRR